MVRGGSGAATGQLVKEKSRGDDWDRYSWDVIYGLESVQPCFYCSSPFGDQWSLNESEGECGSLDEGAHPSHLAV